MTFVSHAQNLEDVSLHRALKSVEKGVYIDVGANDPIVHSVTCAFYERGWRGINIEPVNYWFQRLAAARPEDQNLKVAAADAAGTLKLFEVVGTGLSTIDARHAASHRAAGFEVREVAVPARRLDDICDEQGVTEIHFLKIDVEGAEGLVLSGIDLTRLRPWIIVVEATEPLSSVSTHERWEALLTGRRYIYAYFDGLNRYYVAREHEDLKVELAVPPNCFDNYMRFSEWEATTALDRLRRERAAASGELSRHSEELANARQGIARLEGELANANAKASSQEAVIYAREMEIASLYQSLSWKVTGPLRTLKHLVVDPPGGKLVGRSGILDFPARSVRASVSRIRVAVNQVLGRARDLKRRVKGSAQPSQSVEEIHASTLQSSVRDVYEELRRARAHAVGNLG